MEGLPALYQHLCLSFREQEIPHRYRFGLRRAERRVTLQDHCCLRGLAETGEKASNTYRIGYQKEEPNLGGLDGLTRLKVLQTSPQITSPRDLKGEAVVRRVEALRLINNDEQLVLNSHELFPGHCRVHYWASLGGIPLLLIGVREHYYATKRTSTALSPGCGVSR